MNIRRLIVPIAMALVAVHAGQGFAQGAFPAPPVQGRPLVNDPAFPPVNGGAVKGASDPAFPPVNGASAVPSLGNRPAPTSFPVTGTAPITGSSFERSPAGPTQARGPADACMKGFLPLREEAEKRGKMIKAASDRHAPPQEACKLIGEFSLSEVKMIKYIESHATQCGIPPQVSEQLKTGHKNTEGMQQKVCSVAQQAQKGPAGPSLSEVLGSATVLPEATSTAKKGGSTFDTLNGNVLTR